MSALEQARDLFHIQMVRRYPQFSLQRDEDGEYESKTIRFMWIGFLLGRTSV